MHIEDELVGHSNRIYCVKFDPSNEYLVYSGGWDSYIVINDIRCKGEERVGEIFGPLLGGETIAMKGNMLLVGAYSKAHYLQVYDTRNLKECELKYDIPWGESYGQEELGFITSC